MPGTSRKFMDETFLNRGEENLLARQWQCEYIYSDLSFTSVLPEAKRHARPYPCSGTEPMGACVHGFINVLRHIRDFGRRRTRSKGTRKRFRGRLHAVDYYVYRLHRLII